MGPLASFPQSFRSGRAFCLAKTPRPEPSFWQNEAKKLNDCREGGPFHVPGARVWNAGTVRRLREEGDDVTIVTCVGSVRVSHSADNDHF